LRFGANGFSNASVARSQMRLGLAKKDYHGDVSSWHSRHLAALPNLVGIGVIADSGEPSARQIYGFTA
jgi:hypothetical protein